MRNDIAGLMPNETLCQMLSIPRALRPEEVDRIVGLAEATEPVEGEVIGDSGAASRRSSEVRWLPHSDATKWLYDRVGMLIHTLNGQHWRFDLEGLEAIQVARYPVGGTYDWHVDMGPGEASLRKLSVTIQLSESDAYEGGDLQFPDGPERLARERGDAVIFPSFMHHRIAPVTSGERWSLVAWAVGPPFR